MTLAGFLLVRGRILAVDRVGVLDLRRRLLGGARLAPAGEILLGCALGERVVWVQKRGPRRPGLLELLAVLAAQRRRAGGLQGLDEGVVRRGLGGLRVEQVADLLFSRSGELTQFDPRVLSPALLVARSDRVMRRTLPSQIELEAACETPVVLE